MRKRQMRLMLEDLRDYLNAYCPGHGKIWGPEEDITAGAINEMVRLSDRNQYLDRLVRVAAVRVAALEDLLRAAETHKPARPTAYMAMARTTMAFAPIADAARRGEIELRRTLR
jgi:hypothetical protein